MPSPTPHSPSLTSAPGPDEAPVPFLDLAAIHRPIEDELVRVWREVLASSGFIGGERVERFERDWAAYCGTAHAVGLANGTDALLLALRALGIGAGDEVVVPSNTFVATAEAVVLAGAVPRFVDVDAQTLLMTPQHVQAALTPRTAAVIAVHLYGQMCDVDALADVCRRARIALIEDAAQAHGATWRGRRAGSAGVVGCFSFYPSKNLGALGDGGALVTDDLDLAARVRSLGDHGRRDGAKHVHDLVGTNSRLDSIQAAALHLKLPHLDLSNAARRRAMAWYAEDLLDLDVELVHVHPDAVSVHHVAVVLVPTGERDSIREQMASRGAATGIHYPVPCHQQAAYASFADRVLPVCEATADRLMSLPLFPTITREQVARSADALRCALGDGVRRVG